MNIKLRNKFRDMKKIIASLMILMLIIPQLTVFAQINDKARFRTVSYKGGKERTGIVKDSNTYDKNTYVSYRLKKYDMQREIRTRQIENIYNASSTVYCLDFNEQFPPKNGVEYISRGEWNTYNVGKIGLQRVEKDALRKAKLSWLFNNMYLPKEGNKEIKRELADKVFGGNIEVFKYLTDSDIEFINQWAVWYFTNNEHFKEGFSLKTLGLELKENLINQNPVSINERKAYMMKLFNYYIANASVEKVEKPEVKAPKEAVLTSNGLDIKYFNVKFDSKNNKAQILSIDLKDNKGQVIPRENYKILDKNENVLSGNIIDNLNKDLIIRINKNVENIKEVNLDLKYMIKKTTNEVYKVNSNDLNEVKKYQPVIQIKNEYKYEKIESKVIIKQDEKEKNLDLALRKSIVKVNNKDILGRVPAGKEQIQTKNLKNHLNPNGKDLTAKYLHAKNPIEVKPGDVVKYRISVFNEGEVDAKVFEVRDRLPKGLKYIETPNNTKYKWNLDKNGEIYTALPANEVISKMAIKNGNKVMYSLDLFVELKVLEDVKDGDILTNIAYISKDSGKDRDSKAGLLNISEEELKNYTGKNNKKDLSDPNYFYKGMEDDDDFEKLIVKKDPDIEDKKEFDLALKKYISKVISKEGVRNFKDITVDTKALLDNKKNAVYTKSKDKVYVNIDDTVIYKIRVYNEGNINGILEEITDTLPDGTKYIDHEVNKKYGWTVENKNGKEVVKTNYLKDKVLNKFNKEIGKINFFELEIAVKVVSDKYEKMLNIAEITKALDENKKQIEDRDSTPGNGLLGEDDIDTEVIYIKQKPDEENKKEADIALRKYIVSVNDKKYNREPRINVKPIVQGKNTAVYEHDKTPVNVKAKDLVRYKLAVYNEGEVDTYVSEIIDNIPEGLEYVVQNNINEKFGWIMLDKNGNETRNPEKAVKVMTKYLSKEEDRVLGKNNLIKAFNKENTYVDFKEVEIVFRVKDFKDENINTTNIAEVNKITDKDGNVLKDRDSVPGNGKFSEDDLDKEELKVELQNFDLKLLKFASNINGEEILNAEPKVYLKNLLNGKKSTADYTKSGNIQEVAKGDVVKYTLRVYNEGNRDGYAAEIVDLIPSGLRFLPNHNINKYYEWVMLDENGNETKDTLKAVKIMTKYLGKDENILRALDKENEKIDFKDVEVVFIVAADKQENGNLLNIAEINKNLDENKKEIKDRDSVPGNKNPNEDDQDSENLKLVIFDLALTKRISEITKTFERKNPVTHVTKQTGEEKQKRVEIVQVNTWDKTKDVFVKYVIRVKNQGNINGYAKEVRDYLPEGLIFEQSMNPDWTLVDRKTIATTKLSNEEIKPGEFKEVSVVLRWDYNWEDGRVKTNWAEIHKDFNNFRDTEDRDSTPGNKKIGEDDMDYAKVQIIPATGAKETYIRLALVALTIIGLGVLATKKLVLDKKYINM